MIGLGAASVGVMRVKRHQSALIVASVLTVGSFVGATAYTEHRLIRLDALTSTIETNAAPSIEYLGRAGTRLERLRALMVDAIDRRESGSGALEGARAELGALEEDIDHYLQLTPLPGERDLWNALRRELAQAAVAGRAVIRAVEAGDRETASLAYKTQADPALDRATNRVLEVLQFDVGASERLAREVREVRRTTTRQMVILELLAIGVALATVVIAFRASREHDRLAQLHSALLEERVSDLDRFAGRVAHDILSPLDTVAMALALVARSDAAHADVHISRAQRSVQRVKQLVEGLLRFARAGAEVDSESRCPVNVVLANVAADCSETAAEKDITVVVEPCDPIQVAAAVGVLTSVVQNLVANAIKYMGDGTTRRVALRARARAGRVAIEVADTGPGIDPELRRRMFEPFVRGDHRDAVGLGLGLATVKRLAEAHGGTVDVESTVGVGTVFRVEFPMAGYRVADAVTSAPESAAHRT